VALDGGSELTLLHVGRSHDLAWERFPGIRDTLARWGVLQPAASRADLSALGVSASKVNLRGGDAARGILHRVTRSRIQLVVLMSRRRTGLRRWLRPSVAEAVSRQARAASLVLPSGAEGFVDKATGRVALRRVLVPVLDAVGGENSLEAVGRLIRTLGVAEGEVRVLGIDARPEYDLPAGWPSGWTVTGESRTGAVVDRIIDESTAWNADLVVVATRGAQGSTTAQVLRRTRVPVLVVPEAM
jgi:nucleotide-binding universal stress UspA family protein